MLKRKRMGSQDRLAKHARTEKEAYLFFSIREVFINAPNYSVDKMNELNRLIDCNFPMPCCAQLLKELSIFLSKSKQTREEPSQFVSDAMKALAIAAMQNLNYHFCNKNSRPFKAWIDNRYSATQLAYFMHNVEQVVTSIGFKEIDKIFLGDTTGITNASSESLTYVLAQISYKIAYSWEVNIPTEIRHTIYSLGVLAREGCFTQGSLYADAIKNLLRVLEAKSHHATPQDISNTLYALGELAKKNFIGRDAFEPLIIKHLLGALKAKSCDAAPQDMSNTLYALSELAKKGLIEHDAFEPHVIKNLLRALDAKYRHAKPQNISNTLYALAELARKNLLGRDVFEPLILKNLVYALEAKSHYAKPQEISNTLYALGELAKKSLIERNAIDVVIIKSLLRVLEAMSQHTKPQDISNTLYALGELAKKDLIGLDAFEPLIIKHLLGALKVNSCYAEPQDMSNTLYALSELAKKGLIEHDAFEPHIIKNIIRGLDAKYRHAKPQEISNTLYAVGELAKKDLIGRDVFEPFIIKNLLCALGGKSQHLKPQDISNTLYTVGELAKKGFIEHDTIDAAVIKALLRALEATSHPTKPQDISNTLYAVGELAKKGFIEHNTIDATIIKALLRRLAANSCYAEQQHISNTLYALGELAKKGFIEQDAIEDDNLHCFMKVFLECDLKPTIIDLFQFFSGLAGLFKHKVITRLPAAILANVSKSLLSHYIHPRNLASLIGYLVILQSYIPREIFVELWNRLPSHLNILPQRLNASLIEDINTLQDEELKEMFYRQCKTPNVSKMELPQVGGDSPPNQQTNPLTLPEAVHATTLLQIEPPITEPIFSETNMELQQEIFYAIQNKNLETLERVLNLTAREQDKALSKSHSTRGGNRRRQYRNDDIVRNFFCKIHFTSLYQLIIDAEACYFNTLLQSCSLREFYYLCKHEDAILYPLFLYLPLAQLESFITMLVKEYALLSDHQALLNVIEALSIRYANTDNQEEQEQIMALQQDLFKCGTKAHYHHVNVYQILVSEQYYHQQQEKYQLVDLDTPIANEKQTTENKHEAVAQLLFALERSLECPICCEVVKFPVTLVDRSSYEEHEIREWLKNHNTSPATGLVLNDLSCTPNGTLREVSRIYHALKEAHKNEANSLSPSKSISSHGLSSIRFFQHSPSLESARKTHCSADLVDALLLQLKECLSNSLNEHDIMLGHIIEAYKRFPQSLIPCSFNRVLP